MCPTKGSTSVEARKPRRIVVGIEPWDILPTPSARRISRRRPHIGAPGARMVRSWPTSRGHHTTGGAPRCSRISRLPSVRSSSPSPTSPPPSASRRTSSSSTASTRPRSRWPCSSGSRGGRAASTSTSPPSRRPRSARARRRPPSGSRWPSTAWAARPSPPSASRRSGRCSASRAAPRAAATRRWCRWRTSTST